MRKQRHHTWFFTILAAVVSLVFMLPPFFLLINSFKPYKEIMTSFISFPKSFYFDNYVEAWKATNYLKSFTNSLAITVFSVSGIILLSSMAAYKLARTATKQSWIIFIIFSLGMIIPFHAYMMPLMKWTTILGLNRSIPGLIMVYWGLGCPLAIFLYHGFTKSIPLEIEEAAVIDGCSPFQRFFLVVLPLLKPVTSTVAVLNVLWIWNDFLLPMLMIFMNRSLRTIPLMQYSLYGEYNAKWNVAIAAVIISIIPCIIFFIVMQKQIVKGAIAGSLKG